MAESPDTAPSAVPETETSTPETPMPATPDKATTPPTRVQTLPEAKEVTKARAHDLRAMVGKYVQRHLPAPPQKPVLHDEPPRLVGDHAHWLPLLRTVPWVLGLLFVLSFVWDFNGITITLFGTSVLLEGLLLRLSVSGLIGYLTNWLAITMLFNPQERRPIFGQGLIPAQRERVIYRLAKAITEELINEEIIKQKIEESGVIPRYREMALSVTRGVLEDPDFRSDLKGLTSNYVDTVLASEEVRQRMVEFLANKIERQAGEGLGGMALKAYRFLNEDDFQRRLDKAIQELPQSLDVVLDQMDALLDTIPEKIEARSQDIETWATRVVLGFVEKMDVYGMLISNMKKYDEGQLETMLKRSSNEQLNYIKYVGGILGFLGGFVIWKPLAAIAVFGTLGVLLYALDNLLYNRFKKKKG